MLKCLHTFPGAPRTTYPRFVVLAHREKKFSQMDCHLDKAPSEVLPARPNGSECGGKTVFEIGRSYRPEILIPYSRA